MAAYTISAGDRGVRAKTLVASTVDTVTCDRRPSRLEVLSHDGAAAIYFTLDGSTPTVGGANTDVIPAAIGGLEFQGAEIPGAVPTVVKLISAGTPTYSVTENA